MTFVEILGINIGVILNYAGVVKLVDTLGLGPSAFGRGGSSPLSGTIQKQNVYIFIYNFLHNCPDFLLFSDSSYWLGTNPWS